MDGSQLQIGQVAIGAGVSVDTVRYYERLKLLPRARRTSGNFRLFDPDSIERVIFIKQAQELGFTLDEIKGLLATGGAEECRKVRDLLSEKLQQVDDRLDALKKFRRMLVHHLAECERELRTQGAKACCPTLAPTKRRASR